MKKRILVIALAVCLVAIIGLGSLAYFQASKNLTNFFAVAGVEDPTDPNATIDPDELFSIKLDEKDITVKDGRTEEGNVYTDLLPGMTLEKDPTVTNTGKYDAWVRVKVTFNDAADWSKVCQKHGIKELPSLLNGYEAKNWIYASDETVKDTANNTITYVCYYKSPVPAGESVTLFKSITIPAEFDVEDMASLATFQIKVTGEAIQAANTGASAQEAFELFK